MTETIVFTIGDFANPFGILPLARLALIEDKAKIDAIRMINLIFKTSHHLAIESFNDLLDVICSSYLQKDFLKR